MDTDFDRLLRLLPSLDEAQLAALAQRLVVLRSLPAANKTLPVEHETMVLGALAEALGRQGVVVTVAALAHQHGIRAFREKLPGLLAWADRACRPLLASPPPRRVQTRALWVIAWGLLYADIVERGIACSPRLLLAHAHRLPSVVDKNFPGYARCGLLNWVVEARR